MSKLTLNPEFNLYERNGQAVRIAMKPRRRRWNWRRALGNLLTLAGIVAATLFVVWILKGG